MEGMEHGLVRLAAASNSESLEFLLARMGPRSVEEILGGQDDDGNNVFHVVAEARNQDSLSVLLSINSQAMDDALQHVNCEGKTALHLACQSNWHEVLPSLRRQSWLADLLRPLSLSLTHKYPISLPVSPCFCFKFRSLSLSHKHTRTHAQSLMHTQTNNDPVPSSSCVALPGSSADVRECCALGRAGRRG